MEGVILKYNEEKILEEIKHYLESTYTQHYSVDKNGFQVQDMLRHLGIDKDFVQDLMQLNILQGMVKKVAKTEKTC